MSTTAYLLSDTARHLRRSFDARVRRLGMTSAQARLLLTLSRQEGENQAYYAELLEVEPISLARMVDRMEEAGLLERRRDPADRRAWRLFLTERSFQLIDKVKVGLAGLEDEMLDGLDDGQRAVLCAALEAIRTNLSGTIAALEAVNG